MIEAAGLITLIGIVCIIFSKLSERFGIPTLLIFLVLGMVCGSDGLVGLAFANIELTEELSRILLVLIMFYGGFCMNWQAARPVMLPSLLLSSAGTLITAAITASAAFLLMHLNFAQSLLVGAVVSSTDAASVFALLRQKRLNLKDGLASILEFESGSNDPVAYTLALIALILMGADSSVAIPTLITLQIGVGLLAGALVSYITTFVFAHISFGDDGLDALFTAAVAFASFYLAEMLHGNGYLAVYICGIVLGNTRLAHKRDIVHFFDGITRLAQIIIFFLFGLLSFPSRLPEMFFPALMLSAVLMFLARPIAVVCTLAPLKRSCAQMLFVSAAGLRGAASLVFAAMSLAMVTHAGKALSTDLFHLVFWVVLISITLQGSLLAPLARKLKLVDDSQSVMRTFNDYVDEHDLHLIEMSIREDSPFVGRALKEITLPKDSLVLMVKRKGQTLIPQGSLLLKAHDLLVLNLADNQAKESATTEIDLQKHVLSSGHPWINRHVADLQLLPQALIMAIERNGTHIVPDGATKLQTGDCLVYTGTLPNPYTYIVVESSRS